ncbi:MAG: FAD-dependent oxidoreductase [Trueperaceae bacterium]|nr:FAD-dependent oxidoreductase [Trueperaceae bacterium]
MSVRSRVAVALVALASLACVAAAQAVQPLATEGRRSFDVVVLGSEPEAISAAIAAAESGARTALLSQDARLGGLFVLGALNVLDMRTSPEPYQRGIFERWWQRVGGRGAFDPAEAERVFGEMLAEAGVSVVLNAGDLRIVTTEAAATDTTATDTTATAAIVVGVSWDGGSLTARQVVDGDADLRYAVAAGARASFGWASFGIDARMADTLVFRIDGVDWSTLRAAARARGSGWARVDDGVAWGPFGGVPADYPSRDPTIRLRGLNLGRDAGSGVWVNALLIHGVDPFDADAREAARARAADEAERMVAWLADRLPGFADARLGAVAARLYVRETRHLQARCVLDADHLLDNVTGPLDVAVGGYPLDVQSLTPDDTGFVFGTPELYGVPLCVAVPEHGPVGLWTVGRSVGYDPLAHASTRVVPLGMAVAEGVGVAAARLALRGGDPRLASVDEAFLAGVRDELRERGAYLPPARNRAPVGPTGHPHFGAYRLMLSRGLALGGYQNDPSLDQPVGALSHVYLTSNVIRRFALRPELAVDLVAAYGGVSGPALVERVAPVQRAAACRLGLPCPDGDAPDDLARVGLWPPGVAREGVLTRGETYALAAALVQ